MNDNPSPADDDFILIELTDSQSGFVKAGRIEDSLETIKRQSQVAMNLAMGTIRATAHRVGRTIVEMQKEATELLPNEAEMGHTMAEVQKGVVTLLPNEVEVEFTIKLEMGGSVETGQVTSLIAKADTNGNVGGQFAIKFKWNIEKPKQAEVLVSKQA